MHPSVPPPYPAPGFGPPPVPPPGIAATGLGIASFVLALVSGSFIWIPLCGLTGFPLAAVGLLLGIAGIIVSLATGRRQPMLWPMMGAILCLLSIGGGWLAIEMRKPSPADIARRNEEIRQQIAKEERERPAREAAAEAARVAAERAARPKGPPFEFLSDESHWEIMGETWRRVSIEAWGDLNADNLEKIVVYAANMRSEIRVTINVGARDPHDKNRWFNLAWRRNGVNGIERENLRAYREAAGLDTPASTQPATAPTTSP